MYFVVPSHTSLFFMYRGHTVSKCRKKESFPRQFLRSFPWLQILAHFNLLQILFFIGIGNLQDQSFEGNLNAPRSWPRKCQVKNIRVGTLHHAVPVMQEQRISKLSILQRQSQRFRCMHKHSTHGQENWDYYYYASNFKELDKFSTNSQKTTAKD